MRDAAKILNQMIFFYAVVYFITGIYGGEEQMPLYGCWIAVLTLCCYLMRRYVPKLLWFLLGHLLTAAVGIGVIRIFGFSGGFLAVLLLVLVFSVLLRTLFETELLEEPGYFYLGVLALCFAISAYMGKSERAVNCVMAAFFATLLLKVVYGNLKATDEFIRNRASSTRMDERKLRRLNNGITLLYAGMLGVILALAGMLRTEGISRMITGWFRKVLQMIFGGLASLSGEPEAELAGDTVTSMQPDIGSMEIPETSPVWKALDVVLGVAGTLFVAAGALLIAVLILMAVYRHFYHHQEHPADAEDYAEPLTMRKKLPKEKRKSFFQVFDRSPAKRIRRLYRKSLRTIWKDGKIECFSPKEQLDSDVVKDHFAKEEREEILSLYEKARYSAAEVTETELKRMQDLLQS